MTESLGASLLNENLLASINGPKRHAACDECRKRKLKCSGELTGCTRCLKQSITCHYSVQKQMGRPPKKRAREDEDAPDFSTHANVWPSPEVTPPKYSQDEQSTLPDMAAQLCPQIFWQGLHAMNTSNDILGDQDNQKWQERPKNPNLPVPQSESPWPDFSTVTEATSSLYPVHTTLQDNIDALPLTPPVSSPSDPTPQCTCLSYLYLCLSHISSLSAFPVNSHILCSLYIAARTAQSVIRCEACPKVFATGVQNVMFTGTLLTVVADAWLRVYHSDASELGPQSASPEYVARVLQSEDPAQAWNIWLHQIVRRAVIGGGLEADAVTRCSDQPSLLSLIAEVENRQRRWHEPGQHPFKGFNPMNPLASCDPLVSQENEDHAQHEEKELLCLRVVGSARAVIAKFNFDPSEFPDGVFPDNLTPESI
ncbi:hypothetical protein N7448_005914 [Penicillium atrosanguineum]|uniref:Uncharacterized protein n=1 Tax=Penicillium atrosanguineum TaxID=1132637 RepID=A0A9W9PSK4_9EURO|nr:Six-hairpin glycosidase [Penicillium atrosanguineum]KAJ5131756.1 hypothetical protein N7448_005914 [Penicillium atrosanguineum]KAJ5138039.1 hypothetical protein N7526_004272 [Penicillium atrosanguineum]KAJ5289425.1 Six-hairpin glycosidase [Penicillium atrosanguineum]KAJ5307240.1 hypothetical protein N7476_007896 [Penicillium atrosanguineum]